MFPSKDPSNTRSLRALPEITAEHRIPQKERREPEIHRRAPPILPSDIDQSPLGAPTERWHSQQLHGFLLPKDEEQDQDQLPGVEEDLFGVRSQSRHFQDQDRHVFR